MLTSCSTNDRVVLPKVAAENSGDAWPQVGGVAPHGAAPQVCERVSVEEQLNPRSLYMWIAHVTSPEPLVSSRVCASGLTCHSVMSCG